MPKDNSNQKIKSLHELFEYVRDLYADTAAKKLTGKTIVEVNWNEGNIGTVDETQKKRVK